MKRLVWMVCIIFAVFVLLSGCGDFGISNKRLEEDILSLNDLALITKINEMTVIEKTQENSTLVYKLDATLDSYNYVAKVNIILNYTKTSGKWILSGNTIDIVSVGAKNNPSVSLVVSRVIKPISEGLLNHWLNGYQPEYKLSSSTGSKESGVMTIIISEDYFDDTYSVGVNYTLDAVFDFKTGWNFTLKDWVYTETMKWAGTYDVTWTRSEPGFPSGETSKHFVEGDKIIGLKIEGTGSLSNHMDKTKEIQNDYVITFTFKDKDYRVLPSFDWSVTNLRFKLDIDQQGDWIDLAYYAVPPGESDNHYTAGAEFISGELEKTN